MFVPSITHPVGDFIREWVPKLSAYLPEQLQSQTLDSIAIQQSIDFADVGVIIAYDCESEEVTSSLVVPAGTKTYSINPLNWQTDSAVAGKELNLGACFADYSGGVTEIPEFTGCYIDPVRGSLKVTDVPAEEYPPVLSMFSEGEYHIYDYQFFFRNLQENVAVRVSAFTGK